MMHRRSACRTVAPGHVVLTALMVVTLVCAPVSPGSAVPAPSRVTDVVMDQTPGGLQVRILASGPVHYQLVNLRPDWLVLDISEAQLAMTSGTLPLRQGVVANARINQHVPGTVRAIFELTPGAAYRLSALPEDLGVLVNFPGQTGAESTPAPAPAPGAAGPADPQAQAPSPSPPTLPPTPGPTPTPTLPPTPQPARPPTLPPAAPGAPGGTRLITLELHNANLTDVLSAIARQAGLNLVTDPNVRGQVTVRLTRVPLDQALQLLLQPSGLAFSRVGNTIVVGRPEIVLRPVLREYRLTNVSAREFVMTLWPVLGVTRGRAVADDATNAVLVVAPPDDQERVQELLSRVDVPSGRQVVRVLQMKYISAPTFVELLGARLPDLARTAKVDRAANTVVLTASAVQMQTVDDLLGQVDIPLPQVVIEAAVMEVPTEVMKNLGVAWPAVTTFTTTYPGTDSSGRIVFTVTAPPVTTILNTLISESKAHLLANPRLAVRDGETARMNIGDKIPFQVINPQGVASLVILETGVKLEITPRIASDGSVTLRMHPEVSSIKTAPSPGVPPTFSTREADSSLTVKDGASIILAGLIQKNETRTTVKVPVLGDIPILGWLFKSESSDNVDTEIIFIITPHIMPKVAS